MWRLLLSGSYSLAGEVKLPYIDAHVPCRGHMLLLQVDDHLAARGTLHFGQLSDPATASTQTAGAGVVLDLGARFVTPADNLAVTLRGRGGTLDPVTFDVVETFDVEAEVSLPARSIRVRLDSSSIQGVLYLERVFPLGDVTSGGVWTELFESHFSRVRPWAVISSHERLEIPLRKYLGLSSFDTNVFVMMRFSDTDQARAIRAVITQTLAEEGLVAQFADSLAFAPDLWDNVCTYMLGSRLGVAVIEEIEERTFNPNVAIEIGFMRALQRPILVLKDRRVPRLPADLIGQIYREFDSYNLEATISGQLKAWAKELRTLGVLRDIQWYEYLLQAQPMISSDPHSR